MTFKIKNDGASAVTEAELKRGGTILGEKENIAPGLSGVFSLRVQPGSYQFVCPHAKRDSWPFTATGASSVATATAHAAALAAASAGYKAFVLAEVAKLRSANTAFTDAVRAGNVAEAKRLYPLAREHYESIEPVAESFGDLDPKIDLREADVMSGTSWTGYHRIEKALWADDSTRGMTLIANQLDKDIASLATRVATSEYQPAQLGNGATELLNEIGAKKITGEEDTFSHTDLYDFEANLVGARKAFVLLTPALVAIDPSLTATITQRFADVETALKPYRRAGGWVDYSTVTPAERRVLTQRIDALAEPLSQVAGKVA